MALIRTLVRIDSEGRIAFPKNIRMALGLKEQDMVELRVVGSGKANKVMMSKRSERTSPLIPQVVRGINSFKNCLNCKLLKLPKFSHFLPS